jgi:TPR repeat protein
MYQSGKGVRPDMKKAAKLFKLSADQGNAEAQLNLGIRTEGAEFVAMMRFGLCTS